MSKSIFEQTTADKSQLGFDYQDLVCLEFLIDLRPGESVGLEVLDDVHHERINGTNCLVQVKHSVTEGSSLTNRDIDLWKTLYNWSRALNEIKTDEIDFLFYTNKKQTSRDGIVHLLSDNSDENFISFITEISAIRNDLSLKEKEKDEKSTENPIKKYVDYIDNLEECDKKALFSKIRIIYSEEDIFSRLSKKIEFFSISESESLDVVYLLIGVYRKVKYEKIKSGKKLLIDYSMFRKDFQFDRILKISQDRKIDFSRYHQFKIVNNIDPKDGIFSQQLADIDIPQDEITEHAIEYAATNMFIQKLITAGEFTEVENQSIDEEIYLGWRDSHRELYDCPTIESEPEHKRIARKCLFQIGKLSVEVSNSNLSRGLVNGKGIELSDKCRIGWRKDWKELYGK